MITYFITTHAHMEGVGLAKSGHWGGIRYPDAEAAERAAQEDARGKPYEVRMETVRKRLVG